MKNCNFHMKRTDENKKEEWGRKIKFSYYKKCINVKHKKDRVRRKTEKEVESERGCEYEVIEQSRLGMEKFNHLQAGR